MPGGQWLPDLNTIGYGISLELFRWMGIIVVPAGHFTESFAGLVVAGMDRSICQWMGRTLAQGEPLPGLSGGHGPGWQVGLAPAGKSGDLRGREHPVVHDTSTQGVARASDVPTEAHGRPSSVFGTRTGGCPVGRRY